jgi:serine/threonine protein kinase/Flp pilus assembly protein TadD
MQQKVGRYSLRGQLGRGAMGVVFLAEDPLLNRNVAIKAIDLGVEDRAEREFLRNGLLRDARAAAVLSHPHIVGVYDVLEEGDSAYLVMEYVAGESLAERLKNGPRPDSETVTRVLRQIAGALDYAHSKGVIHRDIKPGNVMIDAEGTAKIMDFGIARITDTRTVTPTGMVMGTVEYMAPEQVKGEVVDGRADQFALAAVAYQMLTGGTLFGPHTLATLTYKIVNEMPQPVTARNPALPAAVNAAFSKALAKLPGERYATCSQFVEAFDQALSGPARVTASTVHPARTGGSGKRIWLTVVLGLLIAGALLAIWKPWAKTPVSKPIVALETPPSAVETKAPPVVRPDSAPNPGKPKEITQPKALPKLEKPKKAEAGDQPPPKEADLPFPRGQEQMKAGDYEGAIQSFTESIALHPDHPEPYTSRGSAEERLGRNEAAVRDFSEAIRIAPRTAAVAYSDRGVCLVRLRRDDDAFADFNRALEIQPDLAAALSGRGGVYFRRRQYAQALRDYDAAIKANPRLAPAYQNRAGARRATGDAAGAAADLKMAEQLRSQEKQ